MYLSVILIDSVLRSGKNYYHQVFLEECEYVVKVKKMSEYIWQHKNDREDIKKISKRNTWNEKN